MNEENQNEHTTGADLSCADLFSVFEECLNCRPHLVLEIGYNRVADWCVHIYDATGVGIKNSELIISISGLGRNKAMAEAVEQLRGRFLSGNNK